MSSTSSWQGFAGGGMALPGSRVNAELPENVSCWSELRVLVLEMLRAAHHSLTAVLRSRDRVILPKVLLIERRRFISSSSNQQLHCPIAHTPRERVRTRTPEGVPSATASFSKRTTSLSAEQIDLVFGRLVLCTVADCAR